MAIKTHTFRGLRYRITLDEHIDGLAVVPGPDDEYSIYVDYKIEGTRKHLETLIHEALHAATPLLSEQVTLRVGHELATFLWRVGYRLEVKK